MICGSPSAWPGVGSQGLPRPRLRRASAVGLVLDGGHPCPHGVSGVNLGEHSGNAAAMAPHIRGHVLCRVSRGRAIKSNREPQGGQELQTARESSVSAEPELSGLFGSWSASPACPLLRARVSQGPSSMAQLGLHWRATDWSVCYLACVLSLVCIYKFISCFLRGHKTELYRILQEWEGS